MSYALITVVVVTVLAGASIALWAGPRSARRTSSTVAASWRPSNWQRIQAAASLRQNALQPHHTAFHRAFAAYMGLSQLMELHPIRRARCAVAVSYLYDNLLDLRQAYTGEDWTPLRRVVTTEPSLGLCSPGARHARMRVRYVS